MGTYIKLNDTKLQEVQKELQEIKQLFDSCTTIECTLHYGLAGPGWISFWDTIGKDGTGGEYTEYSGSDQQNFWLYDKAIEDGVYRADEKKQEEDMRKLFVEILKDTIEAIALRSSDQRILADQAHKVLGLIAKCGNPLPEIERVGVLANLKIFEN